MTEKAKEKSEFDLAVMKSSYKKTDSEKKFFFSESVFPYFESVRILLQK